MFPVPLMDAYRWHLLEFYPEFYSLNEEEIEQGWHFCPEFDFLLVGPDMPEWNLCNCFSLIDKEIYERANFEG